RRTQPSPTRRSDMAFVLDSGWLQRGSGVVSNSNAFTILLAVKRQGTQTGERQVLALTKWGGGDTAHDVTIQNVSHGTAGVSLQANFSATYTSPQDILTVDTWVWVALVGSGSNVSLYTRQEGET